MRDWLAGFVAVSEPVGSQGLGGDTETVDHRRWSRHWHRSRHGTVLGDIERPNYE